MDAKQITLPDQRHTPPGTFSPACNDTPYSWQSLSRREDGENQSRMSMGKRPGACRQIGPPTGLGSWAAQWLTLDQLPMPAGKGEKSATRRRAAALPLPPLAGCARIACSSAWSVWPHRRTASGQARQSSRQWSRYAALPHACARHAAAPLPS